jgi:cation:H+ antiporter
LRLSTVAAVPLFLVSLAVTLLAARMFARRLDRLGVRFGLPEAFIGLLTALAADGPEISSALIALIKGEHSVGVGVLVGSNAFNFAAMIGLSGLLAGSVWLPRPVLTMEGATGGAITLIAAAVLLGWLSATLAAILAACVLVPYVAVITAAADRLTGRWPACHAIRRFADARERRSRQGPQPPSSDPTHHLLALVVVDVALIVAGSAGMVQAALTLGEQWHVSNAVLGVLILAPLTSVPNAITGVRLGLAGRGAALVGETFNSNTINLAGGVIVPSLFTTVIATTTAAKIQLGWLIAMTFACTAMLARRRGVGRGAASVLIAMYAGFAALQLV